MYTEKQLERMLGKLYRLERMLEPKLFYTVGNVPVKAFQTDGSHHDVPEDSCFSECEDGAVFEGRESIAGSRAVTRFRKSWTESACSSIRKSRDTKA